MSADEHMCYVLHSYSVPKLTYAPLSIKMSNTRQKITQV